MKYLIVDLTKDLLGCNHQTRHLPNRQLKVHLRKLEHALKEARHVYPGLAPAISPRRHGAKGSGGIVPRQ